MGATQSLPLNSDDLQEQVTWAVALWLLLTFTLAITLTLFLP
ncbi:hypothetical protein SAMN05216226_101323 [Halovenus aranensis]|jgi:hypothetical protein|uniref:Uncharacterized protein n=1 Tax=Halovenus aranensis TaxID=890420 RepID=A0A1G8S761_9EURY|nr:hypothetical protein [Halovenus aranensis]SDJ25074.1 hypothetical protein SAMN05216226_101323 [Halovenus aranensis]